MEEDEGGRANLYGRLRERKNRRANPSPAGRFTDHERDLGSRRFLHGFIFWRTGSPTRESRIEPFLEMGLLATGGIFVKRPLGGHAIDGFHGLLEDRLCFVAVAFLHRLPEFTDG